MFQQLKKFTANFNIFRLWQKPQVVEASAIETVEAKVQPTAQPEDDFFKHIAGWE